MYDYDWSRPHLKEFIDRLTEIYEQHGDIPVLKNDDGEEFPIDATWIGISEEKIDGVKCKRVVI